MTLVAASESLKELIQRVARPYGKLWPLHHFNACNPLVAFENMPFDQALSQAECQLGFSPERGLQVFAALFQKGVFSQKNIEVTLDQFERSQFEQSPPDGYQAIKSPLAQRLMVQSRLISFRELLLQELLANLKVDLTTEGETSAKSRSGWSSSVKKQLDQAMQSYWQTAEQNTSDGMNALQALGPNESAMIWIDEYMTKWLAAYLDDGQAIWSMPKQDAPFHIAWANLAGYDDSLPKSVSQKLKSLIDRYILPSKSSIEGLSRLLSDHNISSNDAQAEHMLSAHLRQLPGWVGYIHYRQALQPQHAHLLTDYLLVRCLYHFASKESRERNAANSSHAQTEALALTRQRLWILYGLPCMPRLSQGDFAKLIIENPTPWMNYLAAFSPTRKLILLLETLERTQTQPLYTQLNKAYANEAENNTLVRSEPDAQVVFCIDVRSEPYRKLLEENGNIETYGFAGFFGLPIAKKAYASTESIALCPILLEPKYTVPERVSPLLESNPVSQLLRQGIPLREQWIYALKKIKRDTFATFSYVESFGVLHAISLLKDSFLAVPVEKFRNKVKTALSPLLGISPKLELTPEEQGQPGGNRYGIPMPDQVEMAKAILNLMGLKAPFSEFVILCGHGGQTRNNPYASALDCGACGANGGGFNALVFCQILNHPHVREALAMEGLLIPEQTRFIAAEHNTTTDEVQFLNAQVLPETQQARFMSIKQAFERASLTNNLNRQARLKPLSAHYTAENRMLTSYDWSQTRPEWGLSKNQAFIIGSRSAIQGLDLEGRSFLHTYHWESDADATVLTTIMTAPMIVGAWINLQYGLSTLDIHRFGSGKKYLHNVVGLFGTYLGNASDLQLGLPYESLFSNDGTPYHYPQRLLVYIQAPLERVQQIMAAHEQVKNLVENRWIQLIVFDPQEGKPYLFSKGSWHAMPALAATSLTAV